MGVTSVEAPPIPLALAEAKAFLRITTSNEDALLAGLVRSAAGLCESFTGRALVARAIREILPASPTWTRLGVAPVRTIEGIELLEQDGTGTPLPSEQYAIDIDAAGEGWVRLTRPVDPKRIQVRYVGGMAADWNGVPEALRHGIVRLTAHLYTNRADEGERSPPAAVSALWRPWRRIQLS